MAIVKMSKISMIGTQDQKASVLKFLMKRGVVQIDDSTPLTEESGLKGVLWGDSQDSQVVELEQKLSQISAAIDTITKAAKIKKPMFAPKEEITAMPKEEMHSVYEKALEVNGLSKNLNNLKTNGNALENSKNMLFPWQEFDIPIEQMETKYARTYLGTYPAGTNLDAVRNRLSEEAPESLLGLVGSDKQLAYVYLILHKSAAHQVVEILQETGFSFITLMENSGTIRENIKEYERKIKDNEKMKADTEEEIKQKADLLPKLQTLYDYVTVERDEKKIVSNLVKSQTAFYLEGWLPTEKKEPLVKELDAKFDCYIETEDALQGDEFPVLLSNNRIATPFEDITNMYSTPSPKGIDPTAIMTVFYIIFFGIMLGDAGYGLLVAIACGFIVKKAQMKKGEGNLIKLIGLCAVSTTVWGFVFGSFFGVGTPALINPLTDVMFLMAMSLVFGIVHIYIGMAMKGYMLLRDKDYMGFFSDIILWYILLTGVVLLIIPIVAGDIGIFAEIGKWLAIIGAVGVILTGGRAQKNLFMRLFKGVSSLYDITGYFGDILSYTRLMALCLSSGVIAQVINLLGAMAGPVGIVVIGLIGHAINLFIGALGAYVHTSRLQFVEFFGKFYESGGEAFTPFQYKTKYTNMSKEEM